MNEKDDLTSIQGLIRAMMEKNGLVRNVKNVSMGEENWNIPDFHLACRLHGNSSLIFRLFTTSSINFHLCLRDFSAFISTDFSINFHWSFHFSSFFSLPLKTFPSHEKQLFFTFQNFSPPLENPFRPSNFFQQAPRLSSSVTYHFVLFFVIRLVFTKAPEQLTVSARRWCLSLLGKSPHTPTLLI